MRNLNPYHIFWGIVEITEGSLSKSQQNHISKITSSRVSSNHLFFHGAAHTIDERMQKVLNNLAASGVHGKIYKITDKQYGMIENTWDGSVPDCPKPFTHKLIFKEGRMLNLIPLSESQFINAMEF
jgi:hypothetical protein